MEARPRGVHNPNDLSTLLLGKFRQEIFRLASMELNLSTLKDLRVERHILISVVDSLLEQLYTNDFLAANLAQAKADRASPATYVQQGRLCVDLRKLIDLLQHRLENRSVHLEKREC